MMSLPSIWARGATFLIIILSFLHVSAASRLFPAISRGFIAVAPTSQSTPPPPPMSAAAAETRRTRDELLQKYFPGISSSPNAHSPETNRGSFGESKRKVPSCPDPLHN